MNKFNTLNYLFMLNLFLGKENDEFTEALKDPFITDLLNNQLILCYEMDPTSPSFMNFKNICILL